MRSVQACLVASFVGTIAASQFSTDFTIANTDVNPDGFTRIAVLANGMFPGPLVSATAVMCSFVIESLRH
jgi:iron transport multicopper oxidase